MRRCAIANMKLQWLHHLVVHAFLALAVTAKPVSLVVSIRQICWRTDFKLLQSSASLQVPAKAASFQ